jgi:hypothetical protein
MAIKKSDLYSSIWASCDELRGSMDASQYKDYVLFMLFIKYVSDKYGDSDDFAPPVTIPPGASFKEMIALKGKSGIGDKINTQVIQPLIDANARLARSDFPDFNDPIRRVEALRFSRMVPFVEIEKNEFNLNLPATSTARFPRMSRTSPVTCRGASPLPTSTPCRTIGQYARSSGKLCLRPTAPATSISPCKKRRSSRPFMVTRSLPRLSRA